MKRPNIAPGESLSQTGQRLRRPILLSGTAMAFLLLTSCGAEPAVSSAPDAPAPPRNFPSPAISTVDGDAGFDDEPALAQASDGSFYLAWNRFRDGADSLQLARFERNGDRFEQRDSWQVLGGEGTYILGIQAVPAGEKVLIVYAREVNQNWDIYSVACGAAGPEEPVRITSDPGVDFKPAGAWLDGTLWLAWESNRGGKRRILSASLRGSEVSEAEVLSGEEISNYSPAIAVARNGRVSVAWHSFREHNYDVFLRERSGNDWMPERRLTRAASIDRHPSLFTRGDDLWLLYENAQIEGYLLGRTNQRRVIVAKVTARGLETPSGNGAPSPLYENRTEAPRAAFDDQGRLWLAYLRPKLPRGGWEIYFTGYNGEQWEQPSRVTLRKGMDRRPSLIIDGDRAVVAFQSDDLPETWTPADPDFTAQVSSRVVLASVDLGQAAPAASRMNLVPLAEPAEPFEAAQLHLAYGEDAETPEIEYNGRTLKLYYGDLHAHSDISVCNRCGDQSIDENYQNRRDINGLDFASITDHGYNLVPYLWGYTAKLTRVNNDPGRLLTFLGQEWTSSFEKYTDRQPQGFYGHRNLIFADPYFPRWWNAYLGQTPAELWAELREAGANFVNIPHQLADTGNVPTDWDFTDEEAQPVAEIFQVRGSYEHLGTERQARRSMARRGNYIQDAWARGIAIGVIASPDHGGGLGKACVWAPELSREAILDAIRRRHTFGTTAARMMIDFRVNGRLMGERIEAPDGKPVSITVKVRCPGKIARVQICRNNEFIYTVEPGGLTADVTFVDTEPADGNSYYYVRVIQEDDEIGWSSPVWLGIRAQNASDGPAAVRGN